MNTEAIIGRRIIFPEALTEDEWGALTDIAIAVPAKIFGDLGSGILDTRKTVLTRVTAPAGSDDGRGGVLTEAGTVEYYTTEAVAEKLDLEGVEGLGYRVEQYRSRDLIGKLRAACKATEASS